MMVTINKKEREKKRERALKVRYTAFTVAVILLFSALFYRLADLQIVKGEQYLQQSETSKLRVITEQAPRGKIMDRNMVVMAKNRQRYQVEIYRNDLIDEAINDVLLKTIHILESNGDGFIDNFPIILSDDNNGLNFTFAWDTDDTEQQMKKESQWKQQFKIAENASAQEAFYLLRKRYKISSDISDIDARKIMALRQEMDQSGYRKYIPTLIAVDVSQKSVFEIEERALELPGVNVSTQYVREYPMGQVASHVLGYLGRISDEEKDAYLAKKYDLSQAWVGKSGVEKIMEDQLTGSSGDRVGEHWVQVDALGRITKEIPEMDREPIPGNNVVLTIDSELQKVAEEALKTAIDDIRNGKYSKKGPYASNGAVVVMNVNTGEILAMASYPPYDLNILLGNEGSKYYRQLINDADKPLINRAISGLYTPGSTFKLATAVAGLQEGVITPNTIIVDQGPFLPYLKYVKSVSDLPACWVWNEYGRTHGPENVQEAIKNSCNYFFFEVADRLGMDRLYNWADQLGLTRPTGIDLPGEATSIVDSPQRRQQIIKDFIIKNISKALNVDSLNDEWRSKIESTADKLLNVKYYDTKSIKAILDEQLHLGDDNNLVKTLSDPEGTWAVQQWNFMDHLRAAIGQAKTVLTPIALVRYVAAVVNGGKVLTPYVVKEVVDNNGQVIQETQPKIEADLGLKPEYVNAIKEGMRSVTEEGGTASAFFGQFLKQYPQITVGGKTGTAQTSNVAERNNALFVAFAPYDKPEIAIAIVVPGGMSGSYLSPVAMAILKSYFKLDVQQSTP